ncbi:GntR family transcriptional regulator [Tropicimonas sp. TH_r6]|uniref:GntR family transcriptional regulator n=1 Tax=Tropicimonas sp. TH_r6 TaxID=3082085 RepID=UPI0029556D2B|nr:GntR family transcriptional regulator [Tropicimonas sp. TH_r6]MDV7141774.1 GntR family transcriptional regulator [Tropicimonas sp. TH_r6]
MLGVFKSTNQRGRTVAEGIATAIHEHRLAPGMKLNEDEVGEIYGVSRTIVRSALQSLSHEKLVEIEPNRGAFVARPTVREAREVFEARALLEPRTAHSAATRTNKTDIDLLKRHIDEEHAALDAKEVGRALRLSGNFHIEIARIANQATIAAFIGQLVARSSLIIALYWRRRNALCESHAHHALLDALAQNEAERAEELMTSHLVDLVSLLDLTEPPEEPTSLKEALGAE